MKRLAFALLIICFAAGSAASQSCATKADGEPLAGVAKACFVKKCDESRT